MKTIFSVLYAFVALSAAPRAASVKFTVLNRWSLLHNYRVLHFRESPASPDIAPLFRGLRAAKIPYGTYNYELVPAPGDLGRKESWAQSTFTETRPTSQVHWRLRIALGLGLRRPSREL